MTLYVGAKDPESFVATILDATFDFTAVTDVELEVTAPQGGTVYTWSWALDTSAPGQLKLTHVFDAQGAELQHAGTWRITGDLITPTERRRIRPLAFNVSNYP